MSLRAMAEVLGVSASTIARDLAESGADHIRVRGRDGKSYPRGKEAQRVMVLLAHQLHRRGLTQARIAAEIGVSQPTVSRLLRSA
jgi:transcriptional regulator with XRE-family HTH domain